MKHVVDLFKDPNAVANDIIKAGLLFLVNLFGFSGKITPSLNSLRYRCYIKSAFKTFANIASLPQQKMQLDITVSELTTKYSYG